MPTLLEEIESQIDQVRQSTIKQNWHPPRRGDSKHEKITFHVDPSGKVSRFSSTQSSNDEAASYAAQAALLNSSPMPELPAGAPGAGVQIEYSFDYNVSDKSRRNAPGQQLQGK